MKNPDRFLSRHTWVPVLIMLICLFTLFSGVIFSHGTFYFYDTFRLIQPMKAAWVQAVRATGIPWWDEGSACGQPLLSNPHYAALYPLNIILLLPGQAGFSLYVMIHWCMAFFGFYRLGRIYFHDRPVSLMFCVTMTMSGLGVALLDMPTLIVSFGCLPWVIVSFLKLLKDPSPRRIMVFSAALSLLILSGKPYMIYIALFWIGSEWIRFHRSNRDRTCRKTVVTVFLGLVLAGAAAAPQILPALHYLPLSSRAPGTMDNRQTADSFPPSRFMETVIPAWYGNPKANDDRLYWGEDRYPQLGYPFYTSIYMGILPVMLLLGSVRLRTIISFWPHLIAGGGLLFLSMGIHTPIWGLAGRILPVLAYLRLPEKFILFPMMVLVIIAFHGLKTDLYRRKRMILVLMTVCLAVLLPILFRGLTWILMVRMFPLTAHPSLLQKAPEILLNSLGVLEIKLLLILLACLIRPATLRTGLIGCLLVLDLLLPASKNVMLAPAEFYRTPPDIQRRACPEQEDGRIFPAADYYTGDPGIYEYYGNGRFRKEYQKASLAPRSGNLWGLRYAADRDIDYSQLSTTACFRRATVEAWFSGDSDLLEPLLRWANVKLITGPYPYRDYVKEHGTAELPVDLPVRILFRKDRSSFAYAATGLRCAENDGVILDQIRSGIDSPGTCFVYPSSSLINHGCLDCRVTVSERWPGRLVLNVNSPGESLLFVSESYHPYWKCRVDGNPVVIERTNINFMLIGLPAGSGTVEIFFRDPWFFRGCYLFLAAWVLFLAGAYLKNKIVFSKNCR